MPKSRAATRNFAAATSRSQRSRHTLLLQMAKEAEELAAQGQRIAALREAKSRREGKRVTQPMVADEVGVGLRAYQFWEAGDGDIDPQNLKALADYLETTPDYIEYGEPRREQAKTPALFPVDGKLENRLAGVEAELKKLREESEKHHRHLEEAAKALSGLQTKLDDGGVSTDDIVTALNWLRRQAQEQPRPQTPRSRGGKDRRRANG